VGDRFASLQREDVFDVHGQSETPATEVQPRSESQQKQDDAGGVRGERGRQGDASGEVGTVELRAAERRRGGGERREGRALAIDASELTAHSIELRADPACRYIGQVVAEGEDSVAHGDSRVDVAARVT